MGPYCNYCGQRCFVERRIPGTAGTILMATCQLGALNDMLKTDYDHVTAVNPRACVEEVADGAA